MSWIEIIEYQYSIKEFNYRSRENTVTQRILLIQYLVRNTLVNQQVNQKGKKDPCCTSTTEPAGIYLPLVSIFTSNNCVC